MDFTQVKRIETHAHSHYSNIRLLDSICKPKDLILTAAKLGLSGICLTDHECLCGAVEWLLLEKELKEKNLIPQDFKCGIGNEIYLIDGRGQKQKYYHFILIAKDTIGFHQLCELSSKAWYNSYHDRGMERVPTLKSELAEVIKKSPGHVIATSACFKKGMPVLTKDGEKNIEDITNEDYILNMYGEWEKVNYPTQRNYHGEGYKITFLENPNPIICTENHKFLTTTNNRIINYKTTKNKDYDPRQWKEAKDLKVERGRLKDILLYPVNVINYNNQTILYRKEWENSLKINFPYKKVKINDKIEITPEVMRLFGLFLGDGSISINKEKKYYCINFTFNEKEFDVYWNSFVKSASEQIGVEWSINKRPEHHRIDITSHSVELVELFYYLFGDVKADTKKIPLRLKNITQNLDFELIFGYALADGYFRKNTSERIGKSGAMTCASISKQLIYNIQSLLREMGIRSSISEVEEKTDKNGVHHQKSYYLYSSNTAWLNINKLIEYNHEDIINIFNKAIEHCSNKYINIHGIYYKKVYIKNAEKIELNETVHCLNVDSHSFVCNGVIVHNCIAGEDAQWLLRLHDAEKTKNQEQITFSREKLNEYLDFCLDLFGEDFYIEVAPSTNKDQIMCNQRIEKVARAFGIKMIYGCDAHYLLKNDRFVHKAYLNSKEGEREVDSFYEFAHLMDNNEAYEYLSKSYNEQTFIELCNNSMEIYNKIGTYDIFRNPIIPQVKVKNYPKKIFNNPLTPTLNQLFNSDNVQERYWMNECWNEMEKTGWSTREEYIKRLETEADIIYTIGQKLGNCLFEYFNSFQHFIDLFWECGSLVGPGRGSSVCFLSNRLMGITQLDPIEWGLAEWRFLNKERTELPDIDIDLNPSKRPIIFKKIREERGELRLLQVATFGTEGTKSSILTACRGYRSEEYPSGIDVDDAQYIASLIPQERGFLWSLDDVTKGNEEKGRKPIQQFITEVEKYPGLIDIIYGIDGLVNKRSQHASGVILYNEDPWNTGAVMRSPNGDLITQFSLHHAESLGDTKFDYLVTEICDKITETVNLLVKDGYFNDCNGLREIYNKYLHPDVININDGKIWDKLAKEEIVDLFQFNTPVGGQAIRSILPRTPLQLMMANALTRLTGEKGQERPIEKYVRFKNDIQQWYQECRQWRLTEEEIKILEPYYLPVYGVPTTQEKLMLLCMEPQLAHFELKEANAARKVCSKKQLDKIPALKEKFISQCPRRELGEYVWFSAIEPQMSYAFAEPHALAYSFIAIQILILATYYPIIYWNCACLIVNSGGNEIQEDDEDEESEDGENENEEADDKKKKKTKVTNYGKVATAIGNFQNRGIKIMPPDINQSNFTFSPDVKNNSIIYGLRGITRISSEIIQRIITNRPYKSLQDFLEKNKTNKLQTLNLIKSGAFDSIEKVSRELIMHNYIDSIADKKQKLTLQNMQMLINKELIPGEMSFYAKLFLFNKFLKTQKDGTKYSLNESAINFISNNFDTDLISNGLYIEQKIWDNIYKKAMDPMRNYLKEHKEEMLVKLNKALFNDVAEKYMEGNISTWEMDSISFYYHEHELAAAASDFDDFFTLSEEPIIEYTFPSSKGSVVILKLNKIIGTVIDKDKIRNTITLLTPTGVVNVRIYKNQYAMYDKQISEKGEDGKKHVLEKSWFSRGTKLMIQGIRRGQDFIPKKYKNSPYPVICKIIDIDKYGNLTLQKERMEVDTE